MVSLSTVKNDNKALASKHNTLTAIFVGATSGIGLGTLKAFAKHIPKPKAIIVGRSKSRFEPELAELKKINPNGEFEFVQAEISLLSQVDEASNKIKSILESKKQKADLLYLSQGYISFDGRQDNADGLDNSFSLRYYGRIKFIQNLLPVISETGTITSILGGAQEADFDVDDMDLAKPGAYGVLSSTNHLGTMNTLSHDVIAKENGGKTILHIFPGVVNTGLLGRSATGILGVLFRWVVEPLSSWFVTTPEDAGERMLYYATCGSYGPGSWSLDTDGTSKVNAALKKYREQGTADKVWQHNLAIFDRVSKLSTK